MEVKINQVVLHLLDPGASEPVLSDRAMDMDADLYEYYTATLARAFASDEVKNCRFLPDSAFAAEMAQNQDFIDLSRRIAGVIFEQMLQYQAIPAGDLAVVDFTADGVPFYGVLKLNYRPGYTHHTELMGNGRFSSMVPQRTLLPGTPKADEAALIDRANGTVRLIEKKFTLDDRKDFYLSTRVFGCTEALQEKAKLKAVCETAVAAVKEAYPEPEALDDVPPFDGGTETAVELLVRNQAVDNQISVEDVRERIRENFPLAAPRFEEALAETGVQGRGVMLDLHAHYGDARTYVGYDALQRVIDADRVDNQAGDMLCLHTGFGQKLIDMGGDPDPQVLHHSCAVLDGRDERL